MENTEDKILSEELEYLRDIRALLAEKIDEINAVLASGEKEVEEMHDYYWENYTEMDEYGYENFDNQQALLSRISRNNDALDQKRLMKKMLDSPYFGRVDFVYDGEEEAEKHYIGITNFSGGDGQVPLIFDWRAPVSGLFYDYEKGPAQYEAPEGMVEGEITSKRQYKIKHGKLEYAVESDFKIDDDILKETLSQNGDVQLKNIIRTIQKEQNQIIRNTKDKILLIQGAAGSGKTSIALHRIAYLLYHDRKNLKASEVLILSPNQVFSNYISHILPELGEENIREMSFDYFAWKELKGIAADCEDCYDDLEKQIAEKSGKLRKKEADRLKSLRAYKRSGEYIQELNAFLLMQEDELLSIQDFHYKKIEKTAGELLSLFYYKYPDIPLFRRMNAVMEYVVDESETLLGRDYPEEEKEKIRLLFEAMYETKDVYVLYNRFLLSLGLDPLPDELPENRRIPYEDVYPILYMKYQLEGCGQRRRVRHLVIDEMQDYSYIQYLIISKLFSCRMTIVGDRCQTMADDQRNVMDFLPSVFGKEIRMIQINKSYRNTLEIADYAQQLIGETEIENLGRHGCAPEGFEADSLSEGLEKVCSFMGTLKDGRAAETCAVICMTEEESDRIYRLLEDKAGQLIRIPNGKLTRIHKDSERFEAGITVTTFYMAKGLEFDQVFFVDTKSGEDGLFRQAKYIAATRALHEFYSIRIR